METELLVSETCSPNSKNDQTEKSYFRKIWIVYAIVLIQIILFIIYGYVFVIPSQSTIEHVQFTIDNENFTVKIGDHGSLKQFLETIVAKRKLNYSDTATVTTTTTATEPKCGYFVRDFWDGRLGSQMFVYASFYGMVKKQASKANKTAFIRVTSVPSSLDLLFENLTIPQKVVANSWFGPKKFEHAWETRGCCSYCQKGLDNLTCDGKNIYVGGYRLSYEYFRNFSDDIKKEFKFIKEIREKSQQLLNSVMSETKRARNECTLVSVHLRRGDFATPGKAEFGHSAAKVDYFKRAVQFFETMYFHRNRIGSFFTANATHGGKFSVPSDQNCLIFLIFGNDYQWNKNLRQQVELQKPNDTHLVIIDFQKSEPAVDMQTMRLCDHAIISAGTFSWWTGFFSPGIVTYQKEFAIAGSAHFKEYEPKTYFPEHWIPL